MDSTRRESRWRRRLKRSVGEASEKEERASTCDKWTEREVVDSGRESPVKDSESGHERVAAEGRVLTTRVWYWEEEEAEVVKKRTEKMRVLRTFRSIGKMKMRIGTIVVTWIFLYRLYSIVFCL
ncbi:hypothetical protein CARUB_v10018244mg [Capsella rubella]|uniref:Uncharacterized protein n=1 Tax=Capsella rubella TaxID=81985 RepID=R0H6M8_9BRAS|nr:hypothetical protein CARUB_v10018244mg [Capsella rubella]